MSSETLALMDYTEKELASLANLAKRIKSSDEEMFFVDLAVELGKERDKQFGIRPMSREEVLRAFERKQRTGSFNFPVTYE